MKQALFNLLVAASLLFVLVAAGLWVQSYAAPGAAMLRDAGRSALAADSTRGRIVFVQQQVTTDSAEVAATFPAARSYEIEFNGRPWMSGSRAPCYSEYDLGRRWLGFGLAIDRPKKVRESVRPAVDYQISQWMLPHWLFALVGMILPIVWLTQRRRTKRRRVAGRCVACGYDLRQSPGRCPECGRAAAEA